MTQPGRSRQTDIYVRGLGGERPLVPTRLDALEAAARQAMTPEAWAYVAGGAGQGSTMRANREAFERWRIVPRVLRDVSSRDLSVELFGTTLPSPILLGPVGVLEMIHRDADLAIARAARAERVPMIFSNQASVPMERTAQALGDSPRWFQLYWSTSNDLVANLVRRAEACECSAIVVTLDTTMLGWRTQDLDLAFLPFLRGQGIAQYTSDPVFRAEAAQRTATPTASPRVGPALIGALLDLFAASRRAGMSFGEMRRAIAQRPRRCRRRGRCAVADSFRFRRAVRDGCVQGAGARGNRCVARAVVRVWTRDRRRSRSARGPAQCHGRTRSDARTRRSQRRAPSHSGRALMRLSLRSVAGGGLACTVVRPEADGAMEVETRLGLSGTVV
jgi:hypothetical protein